MIRVGRGAIPATIALLAATVIVRSSAREPGVYHPDPQHLWNRLHDALFVRVGTDGVEYGRDRIEPLLWRRSTHLLAGVFLFNTLVQNFPPEMNYANEFHRFARAGELYAQANPEKLREVVELYNKGGIPNPYIDQRMEPLFLTTQEKADLVAFMKALSGEGWQHIKAPTPEEFPK